MLRLCDPGLDLDVRGLNARVSRLEDQLASGSFVQAVKAPAPSSNDDDDRPPPDDWDAPPPGPNEDVPPVPPLPKPSEAPTGFWPDFAAKLKAEISNKLKGFIPGSVRPLLEQDRLTLAADSKFVKDMIDVPEVLEPAARIASAMLGRPMRVRCVEKSKVSASADGKDPLQALVDFGRQHNDIITIKNKGD